jgi:hypothetical protein
MKKIRKILILVPKMMMILSDLTLGAMEEAINKILDGMEELEHGGFKQTHTFCGI